MNEVVKETKEDGSVVTKDVIGGQAVERTYTGAEWLEKANGGGGVPLFSRPVLAEAEPEVPAVEKPATKPAKKKAR